MLAICFRCGAEKESPRQKCGQCAFCPKQNLDLVKSIYLSQDRFDSEQARNEYAFELQNSAEKIRNGIKIIFDPVEMERIRIQMAASHDFEVKSNIRYMFRVVLPCLVLLLELICVVIALSQL